MHESLEGFGNYFRSFSIVFNCIGFLHPWLSKKSAMIAPDEGKSRKRLERHCLAEEGTCSSASKYLNYCITVEDHQINGSIHYLHCIKILSMVHNLITDWYMFYCTKQYVNNYWSTIRR